MTALVHCSVYKATPDSHVITDGSAGHRVRVSKTGLPDTGVCSASSSCSRTCQCPCVTSSKCLTQCHCVTWCACLDAMSYASDCVLQWCGTLGLRTPKKCQILATKNTTWWSVSSLVPLLNDLISNQGQKTPSNKTCEWCPTDTEYFHSTTRHNELQSAYFVSYRWKTAFNQVNIYFLWQKIGKPAFYDQYMNGKIDRESIKRTD